MPNEYDERMQQLREGEGGSLSDALIAARHEQEGPKKLSPGKAKLKAGERTTHFADWETEGMTDEELKRIGAHPSQLETLPAIEVEQTRERFEEPKQEPQLTDEQRELARKALPAETRYTRRPVDKSDMTEEEADTAADYVATDGDTGIERQLWKIPERTDSTKEYEFSDDRKWFEADSDEEGDTGAWESDEQEAFEPFEKVETPNLKLKPFELTKPIPHKER
tara:strand:+ start:258 stop:926 length:669 start_codon:yes stop_codon:yes gene_type:complete